jgi:7-carboxy-7-deazaguanine synthase
MLRITEIFYSIQGESNTVGYPTTFVRLTGCPMRCTYCDTAYAFHGGEKMEIDNVLEKVKDLPAKHITVTGGEPLAQPECWALLTTLCDEGYAVSLETGGAISIEHIDQRVYIVLDVKTPASGEEQNNHYANLDLIKNTDALKYVICDQNDYLWAKQHIAENQLTARANILFSPSADQLAASQLADWILQDQLEVRLQVQLHKILWGNQAGR